MVGVRLTPDRYEFSRMDYVYEVTLARAIQRARVGRFPLQIFAVDQLKKIIEKLGLPDRQRSVFFKGF
jgi:hypothetical protein